MATLSEMFIGDIQKQNSEPLSKSDAGWNVGAQLAQLQQQKQQHAAQIAQKQQELQLAKLEKIGGWMEAWSKMPEGGAKKAFADKFIPNGIQALGMQDQIHPLNQEAMLKDSKLATGVLAWVRGGGDPKILNDPNALMENAGELIKLGSAEEIAAVSGDMQKALGEAHEQALDRQTSIENSKRQAAASANKGGAADERFDIKNLMTLKEKFDARTTKDVARYTASQNIMKLLESKTPMSDSAVRTQLARLSGEVGPLSDFDVRTWSGDPSVLQQAAQWMQRASTGTLTEENREQMKSVARIMAQVVKNRITAEADRSVSLGKHARIDEKTMRESLAVDKIIGDQGKKHKMSNGKEYSETQLKEYMKRNKGKNTPLMAEIKQLGIGG